MILSAIQTIDQSVTDFFFRLQTPFLNKIFLVVTSFGNWQSICVAVILISIFWIVKKKYSWIVNFLLTLLACEASVYLIKHIVSRPRPMWVSVYQENSFSFPSGHATIAVTFYGFLLFLFWKQFRKKTRIILLVTYLLWVFLIGLSRIYLGVHYLSDVLAGYVLGFVWLLIGIYLSTKIKIESK